MGPNSALSQLNKRRGTGRPKRRSYLLNCSPYGNHTRASKEQREPHDFVHEVEVYSALPIYTAASPFVAGGCGFFLGLTQEGIV